MKRGQANDLSWSYNHTHSIYDCNSSTRQIETRKWPNDNTAIQPILNICNRRNDAKEPRTRGGRTVSGNLNFEQPPYEKTAELPEGNWAVSIPTGWGRRQKKEKKKSTGKWWWPCEHHTKTTTYQPCDHRCHGDSCTFMSHNLLQYFPIFETQMPSPIYCRSLWLMTSGLQVKVTKHWLQTKECRGIMPMG